MKQNINLNLFLAPYPTEIQELTLSLRKFITELCPYANELIWDNYNAVALAYSKSEKLKDAFCHIAVYAKHVNFGFNRGAELGTTNLKLTGTGKLIRHLSIKKFDDLPQSEIMGLVLNAVDLSDSLNPALQMNQSLPMSLVMSISEKKRRPKTIRNLN